MIPRPSTDNTTSTKRKRRWRCKPKGAHKVRSVRATAHLPDVLHDADVGMEIISVGDMTIHMRASGPQGRDVYWPDTFRLARLEIPAPRMASNRVVFDVYIGRLELVRRTPARTLHFSGTVAGGRAPADPRRAVGQRDGLDLYAFVVGKHQKLHDRVRTWIRGGRDDWHKARRQFSRVVLHLHKQCGWILDDGEQ